MNASDAYELSKKHDDVSVIITAIKTACGKGLTSISLPRLLNEFEIKNLTSMGYIVIPTHDPSLTAFLNSKRADWTMVSWTNGGYA